MPLAPALASTTPLLGVAALLNDDANSSFLATVTAAGGGVSIVDGRSQVRFAGFSFFSFFAQEDMRVRFVVSESLKRGIA